MSSVRIGRIVLWYPLQCDGAVGRDPYHLKIRVLREGAGDQAGG